MAVRVLFVDDDPNVLSGLRRMLHSMRGQWEMAFATGGHEALAILEKQPHDVVVSDMRMPQMDGAELLSEVRRRYPQTIRIILSGHSDHEMILNSIGPTHQYLTKPCEPSVLRGTIERALALSQLLADEGTRAVIGQMESVPSMPALFTELVDELQSPNASLQTVAEIISRDVGMTTQILHLVNSAFFGLRREISSPAAAVTYLGLNTVMALVTTLHIFQRVDEAAHGWLNLDAMWRHSMGTASLARAIARDVSTDKKLIEDAFAGGLIHDLGRIILGTSFPDRYREIMERSKREQRPLIEVERETFGATHAEVGAYLIGIWGLPNPIAEALAFRHRPSQVKTTDFTPLTAVHVACALDHQARDGGSDPARVMLDEEYLRSMGLQDKVGRWRELAGETSQLAEHPR